MQIFSNGSMTAQAGVQSFDQLPFAFGMPAEQGQQFYDILQQTIQDIQAGELDNQAIAEQLSFIEQSIPDDLYAKLNDEFNLDELEETDKELSAKAFAVLNYIDNLLNGKVDTIDTKVQLEDSMFANGISQSNIETAIEMLDKISQTTEQSLQAIADQQAKNSYSKLDAISHFNTDKITNPQNLAEKILTGKQIVEPTTTQVKEQPIIQTQQATQETTEELNPTSANLNAKEVNPNKAINEMLSLFKQTKQQATDAGLNLDAKTLNKAIKEQQAPDQTNIIEKATTSTLNANQTQAQSTVNAENILKQDNSKTNGAINKSEFKELSSKFVADISSEVKAENPDIQIEEFTPVNNTTRTENNVNLNHSLASAKATTAQINMENLEAAQVESFEKAIEVKESQEAKLASNFNQQLYKTAQEANTHMQVNAALKTFKDQKMQQLKIKLNPEELGSISIEMEMIDGAARGIINVERPEVAQQLAQNLKDMFQGFKQAGINVDDIVVQVEDEKHQQGKQSQQQTRDDEQQQNLQFTFSENDLVDIQV